MNSIDSQIKDLTLEGWSKEQAQIRVQLELEIRKGKGNISDPEYKNRFREKTQRYHR